MTVSRIVTLWLLFAGAVLLTAFGSRTAAAHVDALRAIYAIGSLLVIGIPGIVASSRLTDYLYQHHRELWTYLTSVGNTHVGTVNGARSLPWITQPDSSVPPDLIPFRQSVRAFQRLGIWWFVTTPAMWLVLLAA